MLASNFKHSLDAKNRIFVPAKHREVLGESFMVAKSIRKDCLLVYSENEWKKYVEPLNRMTREEAEDARRFIYEDAAWVTPDAQGRVQLNEGLIEHAKLVKEALIIGYGDYAEIWSPDEYKEAMQKKSREAVRADMAKYGL